MHGEPARGQNLDPNGTSMPPVTTRWTPSSAHDPGAETGRLPPFRAASGFTPVAGLDRALDSEAQHPDAGDIEETDRSGVDDAWLLEDVVEEDTHELLTEPWIEPDGAADVLAAAGPPAAEQDFGGEEGGVFAGEQPAPDTPLLELPEEIGELVEPMEGIQSVSNIETDEWPPLGAADALQAGPREVDDSWDPLGEALHDAVSLGEAPVEGAYPQALETPLSFESEAGDAPGVGGVDGLLGLEETEVVDEPAAVRGEAVAATSSVSAIEAAGPEQPERAGPVGGGAPADAFTLELAATLESLADRLRAQGVAGLGGALAQGDRLESSLALFLAGYRAGRGE